METACGLRVEVKWPNDLLIGRRKLAGVLAESTGGAGADPIVLGESVNTVTTYGFDPVTGMQEPKATLCQIAAA